MLAIGLESGQILLTSGNPAFGIPWALQPMPAALCHEGSVTRLAWRPAATAEGGDARLLLASSSVGNTVRITYVDEAEQQQQ